MAITLPYENLTWLQNGEPVSGGTTGSSDGVLNRPLIETHEDVKYLRDIVQSITGTGGAGLDANAIKTALTETTGLTNDDACGGKT